MHSLGVFCFLWDDLLFNPRAEDQKQYLNDPEFLLLRREERLLALELVYIKLSVIETAVSSWKETAGRHFWLLRQLLDRVDVPPDILDAINVEQQVNMMDPDFSFFEWLKNHSNEQECRL